MDVSPGEEGVTSDWKRPRMFQHLRAGRRSPHPRDCVFLPLAFSCSARRCVVVMLRLFSHRRSRISLNQFCTLLTNHHAGHAGVGRLCQRQEVLAKSKETITLRFMKNRRSEVPLVEISGALDIGRSDGDVVESHTLKGGPCSTSGLCGSRNDC